MDTPAGRDEYGTPDSQIARCADCRNLFRVGGWHNCPDVDEFVPWADFNGLKGGPDAYPEPPETFGGETVICPKCDFGMLASVPGHVCDGEYREHPEGEPGETA